MQEQRLKRICLGLLLVLGFFGTASAATPERQQAAARLLEKRKYAEVIDLLQRESGGQNASGAADLTLGMAYYRSAVLHRELHRSAVSTAIDHLRKMASVPEKDRGRFVDLYLADALLESGNHVAALPAYERFLTSGPTDTRFRQIAKARIGLCRHLAGDREAADTTWAEIDPSLPEVKAELASVYQAANRGDRGPAALIEDSLAAARAGAEPSPRMMVNALSMCAGNRQLDRCLDLLRKIDARSASYRETLGRTKSISYYDPALLRVIAALHGAASLRHLERAARDPKLKDAAGYSLAQAQAVFGSVDQAAKIAGEVIASPALPEQYKDRMRAWQASVRYQKDRNAAVAQNAWAELMRKRPGDPDLAAEVLDVCGWLRIDCSALVDTAAAAAEAGDGRKFMVLHAAVGRRLLAGKDPVRALAFLEAGRDKSNKNKIEANDPVLLVNLADAYVRTKKYSEALEIYFEMSKQFPEVRQIQDALQGIYAVEQKSAGDVKIN